MHSLNGKAFEYIEMIYLQGHTECALSELSRFGKPIIHDMPYVTIKYFGYFEYAFKNH